MTSNPSNLPGDSPKREPPQTTSLPENQHVSLVAWGVVIALVTDVLWFILMVASERETAEPLLVAFTSWIVAQCGLCCTAFQRSSSLREGAAALFLLLVTFGPLAGIGIVSRDDQTLGGMMIIGAGIAVAVGLFLHTVPLLLSQRVIFRDGTAQFSIWQIMIFMALVGVISTFFIVAGEWAVRIGWILLFLFGPTVATGLVLNYVDRSTHFLFPLFVLWGIVGIFTLAWRPVSAFLALYLIPQTLGCTIGGLILLQVPPSGPYIGDPLPRSFTEPPSPFDEPEASAETDFS